MGNNIAKKEKAKVVHDGRPMPPKARIQPLLRSKLSSSLSSDEDDDDIVQVDLSRSNAGDREHNVKLPRDMMMLIASFLRVGDIGRAARTCKSWRRLCYDDQVWRGVAAREGISLKDDVAEGGVRMAVVKQMSQIRLEVVTLFFCRSGRIPTTRLHIKVPWNATVGDVIDAAEAHPNNRQRGQQLFAFNPSAVHHYTMQGQHTQETGDPNCTWPFTDWREDRKEKLSKSEVDKLRALPARNFVKTGSILANNEETMCD